jgi:hypothetical protein
VLWFVSAIPAGAPDYPIVRDWVRAEYAKDVEDRSFLWRIEVDCSNLRQRVTDSYIYRDNNLRGPFQPFANPRLEWKPTEEGAVMRTIVDAICRGARR